MHREDVHAAVVELRDDQVQEGERQHDRLRAQTSHHQHHAADDHRVAEEIDEEEGRFETQVPDQWSHQTREDLLRMKCMRQRCQLA